MNVHHLSDAQQIDLLSKGEIGYEDLSNSAKHSLILRAMEFLTNTLKANSLKPEKSLAESIALLDRFESYGNDQMRHALVHSLDIIGSYASGLHNWLSPHVRHICQHHAEEHEQRSVLDRLLGRDGS